jgi:DNA mismatch endonuclease, patch repair protein
MQAIRCKDTGIELALRKELWSRGIHYRKNCKKVFGHPDIAFIGKKVAVFCDSEFWHGYNWDSRKCSIKTNSEFWIAKIERNIRRDREVDSKLESEGWTVLRFWGREIKMDVKGCADRICDCLK